MLLRKKNSLPNTFEKYDPNNHFSTYLNYCFITLIAAKRPHFKNEKINRATRIKYD